MARGGCASNGRSGTGIRTPSPAVTGAAGGDRRCWRRPVLRFHRMSRHSQHTPHKPAPPAPDPPQGGGGPGVRAVSRSGCREPFRRSASPPVPARGRPVVARGRGFATVVIGAGRPERGPGWRAAVRAGAGARCEGFRRDHGQGGPGRFSRLRRWRRSRRRRASWSRRRAFRARVGRALSWRPSPRPPHTPAWVPDPRPRARRQRRRARPVKRGIVATIDTLEPPTPHVQLRRVTLKSVTELEKTNT
ncbi:MAG: hypothetical protein QOJ25_2769 [Solirubrobacteraceae bacterium]|nr:hypothetical protein [Solirubrobacteraceae bacterium]